MPSLNDSNVVMNPASSTEHFIIEALYPTATNYKPLNNHKHTWEAAVNKRAKLAGRHPLSRFRIVRISTITEIVTIL